MTLRDQNLAAPTAAALALALAVAAATSAHARDDGVSSLSLEMSAFRNAKGTLNCRLFTDPESFPDGEGVRTVSAAITGTQVACAFDELPPGTYAVAVVHDENGNGRLDKNFLGIPTEGYGVSNNRTYAASSPKWQESRFTLEGSGPAVLRVTLRY